MLTLHHYTVVVSTRNGGFFYQWALALQEYTFTIVHHKGTLMPPTRFTQVPVAITSTTEYTIDLQQAQIED